MKTATTVQLHIAVNNWITVVARLIEEVGPREDFTLLIGLNTCLIASGFFQEKTYKDESMRP